MKHIDLKILQRLYNEGYQMRLPNFAPMSEPLSYDDAMLYCYTCTHNNRYDWLHCVSTVEGRHTLYIAAPIENEND